MISKYDMLVNSLDKIADGAPEQFGKFKITKASTEEDINRIRSNAYIHLLLLVKFGVQNYKERFNYITDGPQDGGIDAYYIDKLNRNIYIIQSKFRVNQINYEEKEIGLEEIACMDIARIIQGQKQDTNGKSYNGKINRFQEDISKLDNLPLYEYKIILLANLYSQNSTMVVDKLFNGYKYEIFDYKRAYNELVFPYCISTYYQNDKIIIDKNIKGTTEAYKETFLKTSYGKCSVALLFVPLLFVAEIVDEYKNSILKFNPRNYLSLEKNPVNKSIALGLNDENEDFALLNNGITIVCSKFSTTTLNGLEDFTNVHIEDPQIINGGQTAYTLSRKLSEGDTKPLDNKKVLIKIIATNQSDKEEAAKTDDERIGLRIRYIDFINTISNATNKQSRIEEADRRSNLRIQIDLQKEIYDKYGLLYERKTGEFEEALHNKIIPNDQIIKRDVLLRCILAINGKCNTALSSSKDTMFDVEEFDNIINDSTNAAVSIYAFLLYKKLLEFEKTNKKNPNSKWGNGTKYGKYAILYVVGKQTDFDSLNTSLIEMQKLVDTKILEVLDQWDKFEEYAIAQTENSSYFTAKDRNYPAYYKNGNVVKDIEAYWK